MKMHLLLHHHDWTLECDTSEVGKKSGQQIEDAVHACKGQLIVGAFGRSAAEL